MDNPKTPCEEVAEIHYERAIEAVADAFRNTPPAERTAQYIALAHVSALREQTEVLREIRDALGPRVEYSDDPQPDVPLDLKYDIVERRQCDTQEAHQLRRQGWILLAYIPFGITNETKRWNMGRPRTLPADLT